MPSVNGTRAFSNTMQLEADLKAWTSEKASEGKLDQNDVHEIFSEEQVLRFGGGTSESNFHEMIEDIVYSSAPPVWPGVVALLVGILGNEKYGRR